MYKFFSLFSFYKFYLKLSQVRQRHPSHLFLIIFFFFQLWKTTSGVEYREKKVENAAFYVNQQIDEIIKETEVLFFSYLKFFVFTQIRRQT